jgi:hypothetical protein
MTRLSIAPDGTVRGLWCDDIDWRSLGPVSVRRASHVEFCRRRQMWYVRAARPRGTLRRVLQFLLQRPCGEILYWADSRAEALAWEGAHFAVGGPGWRPSNAKRPHPPGCVPLFGGRSRIAGRRTRLSCGG